MWKNGRFVGTGGKCAASFQDLFNGHGKTSFHLQVPDPDELKVEGTLQGDSRTMNHVAMGKTYSWTGKRAPRLHRDKEPQWGTPIKLFDGKNTQ